LDWIYQAQLRDCAKVMLGKQCGDYFVKPDSTVQGRIERSNLRRMFGTAVRRALTDYHQL
jgi:hypothetical protein